MATQCRQKISLNLGLHALGDEIELESLAKSDERFGNGGIGLVSRDIHDERAIDLDHIDIEILHMAERGVSGTEIVKRDAHAQPAQ